MVLKSRTSRIERRQSKIGREKSALLARETAEAASVPRAPVVAVDLDGVLGEQVPHVLRRYRLEHGVIVPPATVDRWNSRIDNVPFDRLIHEYLGSPAFVRTMPVVRGAKQGVRTLSRIARVVVLTKRPRTATTSTRRWVARNFGRHPRVVVLSSGSKSGFPARILVDDNLQNAREFARSGAGRTAVLYSRPWNRDRRSVARLIAARRIIVGKNWPEVTRIIRGVVVAESRKRR